MSDLSVFLQGTDRLCVMSLNESVSELAVSCRKIKVATGASQMSMLS
jgi:hypothetical protein